MTPRVDRKRLVSSAPGLSVWVASGAVSIKVDETEMVDPRSWGQSECSRVYRGPRKWSRPVSGGQGSQRVFQESQNLVRSGEDGRGV